jgi:hypothetical protein
MVFFKLDISSPRVRCLFHWKPSNAVEADNANMEIMATGWRREPVRPSNSPQSGLSAHAGEEVSRSDAAAAAAAMAADDERRSHSRSTIP